MIKFYVDIAAYITTHSSMRL